MIEEIVQYEAAGEPIVEEASPGYYLQLGQNTPDSLDTDNRWQADEGIAFLERAVAQQELPPQSSLGGESSTDYDDGSIPSNIHTRQVLEILYSDESEGSVWRSTPLQPPNTMGAEPVAQLGLMSGARQGTSLAPSEYLLLMQLQQDVDTNSIASSVPSLTTGVGSVPDTTEGSLSSRIEPVSNIGNEFDIDRYGSEVQSAESYLSSPWNNPDHDGDTADSTTSYLSEVELAVGLENGIPQVVGFELVIPERELDDPPDRNMDAAASLYPSETE